jgi:peptide/nickel transport system substrate-binding protein
MGGKTYWEKFWLKRASRRAILRAGALGGAGLAAAAVACAQEEEAEKAATPAEEHVVPPDAPEVTTSHIGIPRGAKWGGLYVAQYFDDAYSLDPHTQNTPASQGWGKPAYNGLIIPWENTPGEQELMGDLLESWEQPSEDEYVFNVRQGVRFHNVPPVNGREFTADDVKYNLERIGTDDPQYKMREMVEDIDTIEVADDHTVRIKMREPNVGILMNLAIAWASMVAREVVEAGKIDELALGTGPFIMDSWERGVRIRHHRNPDYWKKGQPFIEKVEYLYVPDAATREANVLANNVESLGIDILGKSRDVVDQIRARLDAAQPGITWYHDYGSFNVTYVTYPNLPHKPFDDVRVRRALSHMIGHQALINLFAGYAAKTGHYAPLNKKWALPPEDLPSYDPDKARQLLAAAGFPGGFDTEIWGCQAYYTHAIGPIVANMFAPFGVKVETKLLEAARCVRAIYHYAEDYPLTAHVEWCYDDPDYALRSVYHSKAANQHQGLELGPGGKPFYPELDALLEKQKVTFDEEERIGVVRDIQRLLVNEAIRVYLLSANPTHSGTRPYLKNVHRHLGGNATGYRILDTFYIDGGPRASA